MQSSIKNNIYFAIFSWLLIIAVFLGYAFKKIESSNHARLEELRLLKMEEARLQAEKQSYELAKNDLASITLKELQPEDFFSQDVTLVNEIRRLEKIAQDLGVEMGLSGISGTLKTAWKHTGASEIYLIPFNVSLSGSLADIVSFMEYFENLEFITSVGSANFSSAGSGKLNASFAAGFYIRK